MALITKRAGAEEYGRFLKILVAGEPGTGKTRISSTFPQPLIANVDAGMMAVADRQTPYVDIKETQDLLQLLQALRQPPKQRQAMVGVPVSTVVIDTLDAVQKLFIEERKKAEKKDALAIADWGWLGDQMRAMVRAYRNLDLNVVLTIHLKTDQDGESGQTFVKPALQGAMGDEIAAYVDVAALLKANLITVVRDGKTVREVQRTLQSGPDMRHLWLKDRSGRLPAELDIDLTTDGPRMIDLVFGGVPAPASETVTAKPAKPAAPPTTVAPVAPQAPPQVPPVAVQAPPKPQEPDESVEPEPPAAVTEETPQASEPPEAPEPVLPAEVPDAPPEPDRTEPDPTESAPNAPEVEAPAPPDAPKPTLILQEEPSAIGTSAPADASQNGHSVVADPTMICEECGGPIESPDRRDLSHLRFRRYLCQEHFVAAKKADAAKKTATKA